MLSKNFYNILLFTLSLWLVLPIPSLGQNTTAPKQRFTSSLTTEIKKGAIHVNYGFKGVKGMTYISVKPSIYINGQAQSFDFQQDLCGDVGRFMITSKQKAQNKFSFAYSIPQDLQASLQPPIEISVTLDCKIPTSAPTSNSNRKNKKRSTLQYVFPDYVEKPIAKDINLHLNETPQKYQVSKMKFPWMSVIAMGVTAASIPLYQESQRPACKREVILDPVTGDSYVETYNDCEQKYIKGTNIAIATGVTFYLGNYGWQAYKRKKRKGSTSQVPTDIKDCR